MSTTPTIPIDLAPTPGFCIKSTIVNPAHDTILGQSTPPGRKVFVNICYDNNVPPPPPADEHTIRRAMNPQQDDDGAYYVPVVVSQPRQDVDKAGNPSLVFDCVYHSKLRSRALREADFKIFLVELALQRIEAQTSLVLSRQIGTPNIAAKGKLEPRRVWVPTWIAAGKHGSDEEEMEDKDAKGGKKKLIEVVEPSRKQGNREEGESAPSTLPKLKGILKNDGSKKSSEGGTKIASVTAAAIQDPPQGVPQTPQRPAWTWRKEADGQLKITVSVSKETPHEAIVKSTLDVEPRRLILHIPGSAKTSPLDLDLNLSKSDAEIVADAPGPITAAGIHGTSEEDKMQEPNNTLLLKRQRDFEVDTASAEWRVAEGLLVVSV